jgi:hypothetical protein
MSFKAVTVIDDAAMRDIVTTGFESGSYGSVRIVRFANAEGGVGGPKPTPPPWADYPEARHSWWWADGSIEVDDCHGDGEKGIINRATLQSGLELLQAKWPHLVAQLVSGDYDVLAADALLQCAAFGDLIYG